MVFFSKTILTAFAWGLLLVAFVAGCGKQAQKAEEGEGGDQEGAVEGGALVGAGEGWTRVQEEPAWVKNPPGKDGTFRFVLVRRSNLVELATERNDQLAPRDAEKKIAAFLAGIAKEDGEAIASSAAKAMKPVARVVKYTPSPRGKEEIPGSSLAEAWCLWEVPLDAILDVIPEENREAVGKKLATAVSFSD